MNPKLVAKIKAPDTKGKSSIGTGYPISNEWLITARHVVDFSDRSSAPITLEWSTFSEPVTATVTSVELLDNDIALLRCDVPAELGNIVFSPAAKLPPERVGWKSAGYPDVNECKWFDATGIFGVDSGKALISLTLDDTGRRDGWGGMSGAPVFSGDKFCAVIITHDQRMEKRLNAISISWLRKHDAAFCQAIGLNDDLLACQQFIKGQKRQITELLIKMQQGKLFQALAAKLQIAELLLTPGNLAEKLFAVFDKDCLALFDTLLQTSSAVLEQDTSKDTLENVRSLFCLFASLMASNSLVARQTYIKLSVYTKMASELYLAPLYDTNPDFTTAEDGELKGKYSMDASVFTKETGWGQDEFKKEAANIVFTEVRKKSPKMLNAFELKKLNTTIKQRQNRDLNQLHRFELNCNDEALANNPLSDPSYCQLLNASDCLPDLPIVHYGEVEANLEAELSAKMDELFEILQRYGYAA